MQIDNYGQAIALKNKMEAALPFRVRPGKQLMKVVTDKNITPSTWLEVSGVVYAGDEGGITVMMAPENAKQAFAVSLTHVRIDPEHELASEIETYQTQRKRQLMLNDRRAFITELAPLKSSKKKKKKRKGFG
ncbi:MAG: hypothetical protein AAGD25_20445 [Cyanobacteria bacterium P01_F01_bin.150]